MQRDPLARFTDARQAIDALVSALNGAPVMPLAVAATASLDAHRVAAGVAPMAAVSPSYASQPASVPTAAPFSQPGFPSQPAPVFASPAPPRRGSRLGMWIFVMGLGAIACLISVLAGVSFLLSGAESEVVSSGPVAPMPVAPAPVAPAPMEPTPAVLPDPAPPVASNPQPAPEERPTPIRRQTPPPSEASPSTGRLSRTVIQRVVRRHTSEIQRCYERADNRPEGRVNVMFTIGRTGRVESANLRESTLHHPGIESCILSSVRRWTFPRPEGDGTVAVSYPFIFRG
ncbi:MAG: TonB family protein [Sandaracinaceae bacterium]